MEQSPHVHAASRSSSPRSASAPPAPPRRSARTASSPAGVGAARILVGGALLVLVALLGSGVRARALPRGPLLLAAGAVATYQLAFFAAVADTGVAVGTIVALGSGARAGGRDRVGGRAAARPTRALGAGHRAGLRRRRDARARRGGRRRSRSPASASRSSPAPPTRPTRSPPKRMLRAGHAPETVMAGAFGLGAVVLLPVLARHRRGLARDARRRRARALPRRSSRPRVAYVLFARGLKPPERGRDRHAHARRAADRRAAGRDRARASACPRPRRSAPR